MGTFNSIREMSLRQLLSRLENSFSHLKISPPPPPVNLDISDDSLMFLAEYIQCIEVMASTDYSPKECFRNWLDRNNYSVDEKFFDPSENDEALFVALDKDGRWIYAHPERWRSMKLHPIEVFAQPSKNLIHKSKDNFSEQIITTIHRQADGQQIGVVTIHTLLKGA